MVKVAEEIKKAQNGEIDSKELWENVRWCTEQIREQILDQSRWFTFFRWIVKDEENKYWSIERGMGSTEYQDNEEFNYDCICEVEPYEKTIIDYRPIKKEGE